MPIKAIIFDCFGVLYPDMLWTMASEFLGDKLDDNRKSLHDLVSQVDLGFITRDELWERFAEIVGTDEESIYGRMKEFSGLDKRLLNFIEDSKTTYKIGMISNVGHGFIEKMFVDKPASEYFDSIVLSSDVGMVKPDKRIYESSALQLDCQVQQCVFIDDLAKNVEGAKNAGMKAIIYKDFDSFVQQIRQLTQ